MYHPTTRVLTVLELLQAHQSISGPDLAARLEVNPRTIRHYITQLQDLGIPIEAERGRTGGYRLRPGFKLPPMMFTEDEALALTLGLLTARQLGFTAATPAAEGAIAKIERVMPESLRSRMRAVEETLVLDMRAAHATPTSALLTFSSAVQQRQRVCIGYRAWGDRESTREIDPYGIALHNGHWFVVGYCHLRADLRMFRLDRVLRAQVSEQRFERPAQFDCLSYVIEKLASIPGRWAIEVLLETSLDRARELVPLSMALLESCEGGVLLRCYADDLDWQAHFLAGLGVAFVVREPPELREALRRLAERLRQLANRT